jgi:hypothetical protein
MRLLGDVVLNYVRYTVIIPKDGKDLEITHHDFKSFFIYLLYIIIIGFK